MGGAPSVVRQNDPFHATFVSDHLIQAEEKLATDASFRASFIEFIKNGFWEDKLIVADDEPQVGKPETAWDAFNYARPQKSSLKSNSSFKSLSSFVGDSTRTTSTDASGKLNHESDSINAWSLFTSTGDVRAVMLVALIPLYFSSNEFQHWCSSSFCSASGSNKLGHSSVGAKTTRLRELFHAAATASGSAELDEYLAQPSPQLIADFKKAIVNLPIRINVCKAQSEELDCPVMFSTSGKSPSILSLPSSPTRKCSTSMDFEQFSPRNTVSSKLCSPEYTPDQRELVASAISNQTNLKIAVCTSGDKCSLQAIQPVCDAVGAVQYVLSVEAVDRVVVSQVSNPHYNPVPFQQVEDLLLLLPLLVKSQ